MKGFLQRLFGGGDPNDKQAVQPAAGSPLEIEPFSHGLVRIPALDFFGPHAASPNSTFHLIWLDRNQNFEARRFAFCANISAGRAAMLPGCLV